MRVRELKREKKFFMTFSELFLLLLLLLRLDRYCGHRSISPISETERAEKAGVQTHP